MSLERLALVFNMRSPPLRSRHIDAAAAVDPIEGDGVRAPVSHALDIEALEAVGERGSAAAGRPTRGAKAPVVVFLPEAE